MSIFRIASSMSVRLGAVLATAMLAAAMPDVAVAKHLWHIAHHHAHKQVQTAQTEQAQASHLGAMRYYGGPKSPMWREVTAQAASVQTTSANSGGMRYYGGPKSPRWRQ
jgi:hypothetical protein